MDPLMGVIFGDIQRSEVEAILDLSKLSRRFPQSEKWSSDYVLKVKEVPRRTSIKFGSIDVATVITVGPQSTWATPHGPSLTNENGRLTKVVATPVSVATEVEQAETAELPEKQQLQAKDSSPAKPSAPKCWADLVKTPSSKVSQSSKLAPHASMRKTPLSGTDSFFKGFSANFGGRPIQPRGLVNNGNMCFMNAILQPLVHCYPFFNLFKKLREEVVHNLKIKTPLVDALTEFLLQFPELPADFAFLNSSFSEEDAFEPEIVYDALRSLKKISSIKGRQEDAEEFLGFLLDGLHEELLLIQHGESYNNGKDLGTPNDNTWMEVGPKNRTLVTRRTEIMESPITQVFGGRMRSIIKRSGSKDSVMLEPFQSLQLDIAVRANSLYSSLSLSIVLVLNLQLFLFQ
ncbi:hypothetical protein HDU67_010003 [Dinochytrium kinnereticum]|nr:hypothetical protein HDU67_010003 [Dinochytrium kinnereticum]